MVEMAERGTLTILDLLDSLATYRPDPIKGHAQWTAWRAFLCALYGLPMSAAELAIYRRCTGRQNAPTKQARKAWVVVGRRGRKSSIAALIAIWHGAFRDYVKSGAIAAGTRAKVLILSDTRANARQIHDYALAILTRNRALAHLVESNTTESIRLTTGVDLEIRAATKTAGRSPTTPAALLDEIAFWRSDDSANPDREIIEGIEPGMVTVSDAILLGLSSPYAERGVLWEAYDQHFGVEGDPVLVWKADTLTMHDSPQVRREVEQAYKDDPAAAAAEFGANFRKGLQAFVTREVVNAAMKGQPIIRPAKTGVQYYAFCDPSGGSSDSFTLAIAHVEWREHGAPMCVLDLLREWQGPFQPDQVIREVVPILRGKPEQGGYGLTWVKGDRYGGKWPAAMFAKYGIGYIEADRTKSDYYTNCLPLLNSGLCELLDNNVLRTQLLALDRRVSRAGQESIDHPPGGRDDCSNATAGALVEASINLQLAPPKKAQTFVKEDGTVDYVALDKQRRKEQMEAMLNPTVPAGSGRYDMA